VVIVQSRAENRGNRGLLVFSFAQTEKNNRQILPDLTALEGNLGRLHQKYLDVGGVILLMS
jgi:hypothetical protein